MTEQQKSSELKILRLPQVMAMTGRKKTAIYDDVKHGRFVAPIKIGRRSVGWLAHEVQAWIEARMTAARLPEAT